MTKRAQKGGEYGANGEWYEGGTGKQEIAPYQWAVAPNGERSLYRQFAGTFGRVVNGVAVLTDGGNGGRLPAILAYVGRTMEEAQAIIDAWNAGQRWA